MFSVISLYYFDYIILLISLDLLFFKCQMDVALVFSFFSFPKYIFRKYFL